MTLQLEFNEFGKIAEAGEVDAAIREPDFLKKAYKLFDLRERLWDAFGKTRNEVHEAGEALAKKESETPTAIAFLIAAVPIAVGAVFLTGGLSLLTGAFGAFAGIFGGGIIGAITQSIVGSGPKTEAREAVKQMARDREDLHARIETELGAMDRALPQQSYDVRKEFREAFRHAALKQEMRENRVHRAKVEAEAQATRQAANRAASAASSAATTAAIGVILSSGKR